MGTASSPVAVRTRRILSAEGGVENETTVYCSRLGHSVPLQYCVCCQHNARAVVDPAGRESVVLCRHCDASAHTDGPARRGYAVPSRGGISPHRPVVVAPLARGSADRVTIHEVMSTSVLCVTRDVAVESLMAMLLSERISGAPVVDERGTPVGVVSKTDLVRESYVNGPDGVLVDEPSSGAKLELDSGIHVIPGRGIIVADIMTPVPMSLPETASVAQAAAMMSYNGVHRLPVVSHENTVVGILSSFDVLHWLAVDSGYGIPRRARCA